MLSEGVPVCQFMLTCIGLGWTMDFRQGEEIVRQLKDPSSHLCTAKIFGGEHGIFLEDVRKSLRGMQQYI